MKKYWVIIGLVLVVALAIVLVFTQTKKELGEIKIGIIAPLTGDAAIYGSPLKKGIDLAKDEINEAGGINGAKISLYYEDSQANSNTAVFAFNKLAEVDKVSSVIGDMFSQPTLAIAELAQKKGIVLLSPTASSEKVAQTGDFIFSIYPSDSYDGEFLAKFAVESLHKFTAAIIFVQADAMITAKNAFINKYNEMGGEVFEEDSYNSKDYDYRSILTKISKKRPEIIFLPGYLEDIAKILTQAKEIGVKSQFITISTAYDKRLFALAPEATENLIMSAPFYEQNSSMMKPGVVAFMESYKNKYFEDPSVWSAYGYDALKILAKAYLVSRENSTSLNTELSKTKYYSGVTGETTFLENRKVIKQLQIFIVKDNKFEEYKK